MLNVLPKLEIDPREKLEGLKRSLQNKLLRKVVRIASKPILGRAKSTVRQQTSGLKYALAMKIKTKTFGVYAVIGPKSNYWKGKNKPVRYAHIVEKGSKYNTARPFLSNSVNEGQWRDDFAKALEQAIREQVGK